MKNFKLPLEVISQLVEVTRRETLQWDVVRTQGESRAVAVLDNIYITVPNLFQLRMHLSPLFSSNPEDQMTLIPASFSDSLEAERLYLTELVPAITERAVPQPEAVLKSFIEKLAEGASGKLYSEPTSEARDGVIY
jgi:hypothetical protein